MKKIIIPSLLFILSAGSAFAHVTVKPSQVNIGTFQVFDISVPVEKEIPAVGIRLNIPEGLDYVSPTVKPGWKVDIKKNSDGKVTELAWSSGSIPAGQRDDFTFSAKVPTTSGTLQWKAYQTYKDGSVVSWDLDADKQPVKENGEPDFSKSGPYSKTEVINDLQGGQVTMPKGYEWLSVIALVLSLLALSKTSKRRGQ